LTAQIHPGDEQICLGQDENLDENAGAVMPPIVQTSLFRKGSLRQLQDELSEESKNYVYTRGRNPTVAVFEGKLAALERGEACKCFASGMAAVSAALTGLLKQGDRILFVNLSVSPDHSFLCCGPRRLRNQSLELNCFDLFVILNF